MATMVDVAKMAGVSTSTVSHVLNGTRKVEPATRRRVEAAIERTGYRQDTLARAMRRSRSDSIGLILSDAGEPAFADMAHGVEQAAAERGLTLLLANSAEDSERERLAIQALMNRRVDGLILATAANSPADRLRSLQEERAPVVLLDRLYHDLPFDQVGADNRDSMRSLVKHLVGQGHRRMMIIAGDTRVPTLEERLEGFHDGLRDAGLAAVEQQVLTGESEDELSVRAVAALADGTTTAVIGCSTPLSAVGLNALEAVGRRVPGDAAFATFDGFRYPDLFTPRLTTVRQPAFEMGVSAVELLVARLADPDSRPRTVRLHQSLELRESTEDFDPAG